MKQNYIHNRFFEICNFIANTNLYIIEKSKRANKIFIRTCLIYSILMLKNMAKLYSKVKWANTSAFCDYQISKFISRANQKTVCKMSTFDVGCMRQL